MTGGPPPLLEDLPGLYLDAETEARVAERLRRALGLEARFLRGLEARATARGRYPFCAPREVLRCTRGDCLQARLASRGRWTIYRCHEGLTMAALPFEMPQGE